MREKKNSNFQDKTLAYITTKEKKESKMEKKGMEIRTDNFASHQHVDYRDEPVRVPKDSKVTGETIQTQDFSRKTETEKHS